MLKLNKIDKNLPHAVYGSGITLSGLTVEQIDEIKQDLTFNNPAYATTLKYSRYSYTTVSPYLIYYKQKKSEITVPVGYKLKFNASIVDNRIYPPLGCYLPPFVLELRDSQKEAANDFINSNKNHSISGCVQLPTGKGKSILGLYLAHYYHTKTLIVVHKDDLVKGWIKDIALAFDNKVEAGLIKAKSRVVGDFITIATIQTLNRLSEDELSNLYNQFGFVIQDEMHHCPAQSFSLVSNFNARYKLGLTATPERSDGLEHIMNLYFGDFAYKYKPKPGKDEQDILPVYVTRRVMTYKFDPLCEKLKSGAYKIIDMNFYGNNTSTKSLPDNQMPLSAVPYDFRPKLSFQVIDDYVVRNIIMQVCSDILTEYQKGHSCVVFFTQKEHCRIYYEYLTTIKGNDGTFLIPAEDIDLYYGDNPHNDEVLEKAERKRKFITLTTYAKTTEGTNVKQWEVEFLVSSLNNGKNVEQAAGRIRRYKEGKLNPVLLYDYRTPYVYSFGKHSATRDRRYKELSFKLDSGPISGLFSRGYR